MEEGACAFVPLTTASLSGQTGSRVFVDCSALLDFAAPLGSEAHTFAGLHSDLHDKTNQSSWVQWCKNPTMQEASLVSQSTRFIPKAYFH